MSAPVASGWSGRRVGLAPTGKRRLVTAHVDCGPSPIWWRAGSRRKRPLPLRRSSANVRPKPALLQAPDKLLLTYGRRRVRRALKVGVKGDQHTDKKPRCRGEADYESDPGGVGAW